MSHWSPWHGCHKISEGCRHCYVYRMDTRYGRDSSVVTQTKTFQQPIKKDRKGNYKIKPGSMVYTCFSSDFFVEDADKWRPKAWEMIKTRSDLHFFMITKRIHRAEEHLPSDWGSGYSNVTIACTMENQDRVDFRLPIYMDFPLKHKVIICEPLLSRISLSKYLDRSIENVVAGGESGLEARVCNYDWVLDIREQCLEAGVPFTFRQTGARLLKDNKLYRIKKPLQHIQARKAGIDT